MATLADSLRSSTGRRLAMRCRPDLVATRHRYQGRTYWIVKEPIGLHYFRFQEEEYAILRMLDGTVSLDKVKDQFEAEFPPQKIKLEELGNFIGMLHRGGLVLSEAPGQGLQLKKRRDQQKRQEWLQKLSNILSLRFRGINPERLLNWMAPKLAWIYTPTAFFIWLGLALAALTLVAVQFDVFKAKLPSFHQFFTFQNAAWLMVVLGVTKIIHEFGHGVSCKHFGGECHEMGVLLLVLTPCLYCNVSDSWMLPNKWHRAIIGAGGMYVEVFMASVATFVWWYSQPGLLHNICLATMFVCSVSTIIFNGNPLLRYDGYYILADLLEIPNLSLKSTEVLSRSLGQLCLGLEPTDDPFLPRRNRFMFGMYAVASAVYRWVVVLSILLLLNQVFKPYKLQIIGQILGAMSLYGLFVFPLWKLAKFFYVPGRLDLVKKVRVWTSVAVVSAVLAALALVPVPHRVYGLLQLQPRNPQNVYVEEPGALKKVYVKPGDWVRQGTLLAELGNDDLELAIQELAGRKEQLKAQLANLNQRRFEDSAAGMQIPEVQKSLASVEQQLREKTSDLAKLKLVAPVSGTVIPPPEQAEKPTPDNELLTWTGTLFEQRNLGAFLDESTMFCQIGDPRSLEALVVVEQSDVQFLEKGQPVDIKLDEMPYETLHSEIQEISTEDVKVLPLGLTGKAHADVPTKTDEMGVERPMTTSYQLRVFPLDDKDGALRVGLRGWAKTHVKPESVGMRLWRWFSQTFHFRM